MAKRPRVLIFEKGPDVERSVTKRTIVQPPANKTEVERTRKNFFNAFGFRVMTTDAIQIPKHISRTKEYPFQNQYEESPDKSVVTAPQASKSTRMILAVGVKAFEGRYLFVTTKPTKPVKNINQPK